MNSVGTCLLFTDSGELGVSGRLPLAFAVFVFVRLEQDMT